MLPPLNEPNLKSWPILSKVWSLSERKCYYVPKDFGQELLEIKRDVPLDLLPKNFVAYFHFAKGLVSDESEEIEGAYVYIGPANRIGVVNVTDVVFSSCVLGRCKPGQMIGNVTKNITELGKIHNIFDIPSVDVNAVGELRETPKEVIEARNRVTRLILNCILYIHSQDPSLFNLQSKFAVSTKQFKLEQEKTGHTNLCSVPLILLNHSYQKPKEFHVDQTWVRTHPRWQRCGPGFQQVKLIWVEGHVRSFQ